MGDVDCPTPKIFIGVDFGTSRSGFSYAIRGEDGSYTTRVHTAYPQQVLPYPKTRSTLLYDLEAPDKPVSWGWPAFNEYLSLAPKEERERRYAVCNEFKLALLGDEGARVPLPPGISASKAVTDYLDALHGYIRVKLRQAHGDFAPSLVRWCLTVPAAAPQAAIQALREAAAAAGMVPSPDSPRLIIATEPEAAALCVQSRADGRGVDVSHVGQAFMVIDAGGGTVDLTVHNVEKPHPDLNHAVLSEVTARESIMQGSGRIDVRFEDYVAELVDCDAFAAWKDEPANGKDYQELMCCEWEAVKCAHGSRSGGPEGSTASVRLPASLIDAMAEECKDMLEAQQGRVDRLELSSNTINKFFDPSINDIISTAQTMLSRAAANGSSGVRRILLVGGMSASPYVVARVKAALEMPQRSVMAPAYGGVAVLEGAVLYARFPKAIFARRAMLTYGLRTSTRWVEGAPNRQFIHHKGNFYTTMSFKRYVHREQLVPADSKVVHVFRPLYPNQAVATFDVYGTCKSSAKYTTEDGMQLIGTVSIDLGLEGDWDPDDYVLSAELQFGEALITVRVVDEQTGAEKRTVVKYDSIEVGVEDD